MKIEVLLFAQAKQTVGQKSVVVDLPDNGTVSELLDLLVNSAAQIKPIRSSLLVAVNNQFASHDQVINAKDTVACFPPVSGG